MIRFKFTLAGIAVIAVASLALLAACGDDGTTPGTGSTPGDGPTAPLPTNSDSPFGGTRERIEEVTGTGQTTPSTAQQVEVFDGGPFDRMEFTFDTGVPNYTIEYVDAAFACGSGLPVEVAGSAFLEIRMQPTAAHDEAGIETIATPDILLDLPTLLQLKITCDFEGEVVWVAGLSEEVDFRASFVTTPLPENIIIIDVNHPGQD
ncbi:MAG: hypothetical protein IIB87_03375 [Chloroflexi bacterium]|nr:hypothetical protein [Chloroflexota bacterium]